ncbi:hypothetical protein CCMA1212_000119 [Trichoderma ghanense]|uniref:Uncharacterized protein n=1 Tax=Trichoderma ghanense TaxID=65468 RepID=A0ABY2HFZ9_9HYPO
MRSGRKPTLGDELVDAYIFPECTRRVVVLAERPRIPEISVTPPSGDVRRAVSDRGRDQIRLADQTEKVRYKDKSRECLFAAGLNSDDKKTKPSDAKPAQSQRAPEEDKPLEKEEAAEPEKAPKGKAPQASSGPVRTRTLKTLVAFGRQSVSSRRSNSRWWRKSLMG